MGCEASRAKTQLGDKKTSTGRSWPPQSRFLNEFSTGEKLGEGSFSVVSNCKRRSTKDDFVVKMIDKTTNSMADLRLEVDMLRAMQHPNIVKFYGVYYEKHYICIVMDKYKGGDLMTGFQTHVKKFFRGHIPCTNVIHVARQMGESIAYVHSRHVVHRDIKNDNYLIDREDITDPECKIVLADFGSACFIQPGQYLDTPVGTQPYWAPEIFAKEYGAKVDVWAMGVIMYGLVTGCFPFQNEYEIRTKDAKFQGQIDPFCNDFTKKMLDKKVFRRPESSMLTKHEWVTRDHSKKSDISIL